MIPTGKNGILVFILLFIPVIVGASGGLVPCGPGTGVPCQLCHLFEMFGRLIHFITWTIVPPVATIMIMIAGIMFFTAFGNPEKLRTIKKMFIGIFVGLLLIILAWGITASLYTALGGGDIQINWWEICQ